MSLSIRYSTPFVAAGVVKCIRQRITAQLALIVAEASTELSCPSSMAGFQIQFGDDRMPQPAPDWIRVTMQLESLSPTASSQEGIATYRVGIEALTIDQTRAATPSALPGGSPTPDADTTVITSSGIRAAAIAEAAARSIEGYGPTDVPGCYSIVRTGDGSFVPKDPKAFGFRINLTIKARSTWPTGV